jgi:hypothetical protein
VHVYEAGGDDLSGGIYDAGGLGLGERSYGLDTISGHADVRPEARAA